MRLFKKRGFGGETNVASGLISLGHDDVSLTKIENQK